MVQRLILSFTALFYCLMGAAVTVEVANWRDGPPCGVRRGDLVFRRDNGVWSWFFISASSRERRYSHAGIIVSGGDSPVIIHSDANEGTGCGCVRKQGWKDFFAESLDGAVYRLNVSPAERLAVAEEAELRLGVPFDSGFDMENTNKLYCTELLRVSVNAACKKNVIDSTSLANGNRLIAIDDCYKTNVTLICSCKGADIRCENSKAARKVRLLELFKERVNDLLGK